MLRMGTFVARVIGAVALFVLALAVVGCAPPSFASKGTMPPPGPNGEVDPARAPDFIAVAGREVGIAGYVPKAFLFPEPTTVVGRQDEPDVPVYGEDLRTLVGHMVADKGFIPLGVDPATVPRFPVGQGPAIDQPAGEPSALTLYVRTASPRTAWFALRPQSDSPVEQGYDGGLGVGCIPIPAGSQLVLFDRPSHEVGARPIRVIFTADDAKATPTLWVDVAPNGALSQGTGVPAWWSGPPQDC